MHELKGKILFLRNKFFNGSYNDEDLLMLNNIYCDIQDINVEITMAVLSECMPEVINEINDKNILGAGFILNFVHNFPFSAEELERWNVRYFLSVEIPAMVDRMKDVRSALRLIFCACHHIYVDRYMGQLEDSSATQSKKVG